MRFALAALILGLAACSPPAPSHGVAPEIAAAVEAAMPGVVITGGAADGTEEYEVSGVHNGQEYEFDLLGPEGGWRVAQIQRDIQWGDAPAAVRDLIAMSPNAFVPARVIESRQPGADGMQYFLFAEADQPEPVMEVRVVGDEAAVMPPAH